MRYLPLTPQDREEMLRALGIADVNELFVCIGEGSCRSPLPTLPAALSELELLQLFRDYAQKNSYSRYLSFLGGGAYAHFIPEVVNQLSAKGEFLTPYTPYQPEVSQGSLQAMFEYQTMMTMLTGLDVSNASLYDGGTAAAEAVLLAVRRSGKTRILLAANLHPEYRQIIETYAQNLGYRFDDVACDRDSGKLDLEDVRRRLDEQTACVVFQSPNFLGVVEETRAIAAAAHARQAYAVQLVDEAMSLAFLSSPGSNGVDIAAGEAQSFGLPLAFGGPYLGFLAARSDFLRQMPGRIVGQTRDAEGRRGYVLTLSTREQHIKREKATSNICTNQAWCAVRAGMYLATMGQSGLEQVARINHLNAAYFLRKISRCPQVRVKYRRDFYNQVVLETGRRKAESFLDKLKRQGILAGIPLRWFYPDWPNAVLINFTELHRPEEIDRLVRAIGELQ